MNCKQQYVLIKTPSLIIQEMLYWFTLLSIKATTKSAKLSQKKESWSRLMAGLRCFQRLVVSGGPSYRLAPSIGERLFPSVTSFHVADLQVSRFWQYLKEWRILTIGLDSCHKDWIREIDITWEPALLQHIMSLKCIGSSLNPIFITVYSVCFSWFKVACWLCPANHSMLGKQRADVSCRHVVQTADTNNTDCWQ